MKEELLKKFSEWLNEEDRSNWEIERHVEAMLDTFEEHICNELDKIKQKILGPLKELREITLSILENKKQ
jgi:hypothetical protein